MSDSNRSESEAPSLRVPACDSCRFRKIRCDRKIPCSSCQTSHVVCRTTKKRPEKRQRVLVSGRYEQEIEQVNGRLASLERILQSFVQNQQQHTSKVTSSSLSDQLSTPQDSQHDETRHFEGDSSFTAHSKSITQAFESSLNNSPYPNSIRDVSAAVATLRGFLNESLGSGKSSTAVVKSPQDADHHSILSNLTLPPMDAVLRLLRYIKTHEQRFFQECTMLNEQELTSICQRIYFPTEAYSIADFITTNIALYYLFRNLSPVAVQDLQLTADGLRDIVETCLHNADTASRSLRLMMDSTYENLQALTMASLLSIELARPFSAWTYSSAACRMCLAAGCHRLPSYSVDPSRATTRKRLLFWFLYATERSLSLNFGRPPTIQAYDITVDKPQCPEEMPGIWGLLYRAWIDFADVQGEIYESLYCARAQAQPIQTRATLARSIAARLLEVKKRFHIDPTGTPHMYDFEESILSSQIVLLSTLTLVYRCIPPDPLPTTNAQLPLKPCEEALATAREALVANNAAWEILKERTADDWRGFVHWTLLWCPFVPFLVVFGNAVVECNRSDLDLLEKFVKTLEDAARRSEGVQKLEKACKIFSHIARIYLDQTEPGIQVNQRQQQKQRQRQRQQQQQHQDPPQHQHQSLPPLSPPPSNHTTTPYQIAPSIFPQTSTNLDSQMLDTMIPDFPLSQQALDGLFDDWDLGVGAGNAREITSYFEYLTSAGQAAGSGGSGGGVGGGDGFSGIPHEFGS